MTATITERAAAGAAFLDRHRPGWDARVDPGTPDMSEGRSVEDSDDDALHREVAALHDAWQVLIRGRRSGVTAVPDGPGHTQSGHSPTNL